jgi:hypothetical protein
MRPSLSPLEKGAYGTPLRVVSVVVGGPHVSPDGSESMISRREVGAMMSIDVSVNVSVGGM